MRRCHLDDLLAGASRLAGCAEANRAALADRLVQEAHAAHAYFKRFNRPHPIWGNGSLMTRCLQGVNAAPGPLDMAALATLAAAVARFQGQNRKRALGLS